MTKIKISEQDLMDLIYWARRYCDRRSIYAPSDFNRIFLRVKKENPHLKDGKKDCTLMNEGSFFPYAQDGMYDCKTGTFNAVPKE